MNNDQKKKAQQLAKQANALEALKTSGRVVADEIKSEIASRIPNTIYEQLTGTASVQNTSGEIRIGESINISEITSQNDSKAERVSHYSYESIMLEQERIVRTKTNELRMQLKAVMEEMVYATADLGTAGEELQIAALQAPIEPGEYHLNFFDELLSFIKSFRKKIQDASVWLHSSNKRAQKKNYWSQYKKHGSKLLLSGESYSSRSAG